MRQETQRNILSTATSQDYTALKDVHYLTKWLEQEGQIKSVAIIGSPIESLADSVRQSVRHASLFLIVQNAKEVEAFRKTDFGDASIAVGMDFNSIDRAVDV